MRIPSLLLALAAVAITVGAAAQSRHPARTTHQPANTSEKPDQSDWTGTYIFQEGGGRAGAFVEHTIVVARQGGELIADIDASGFQTSRSLRCSTKLEGRRQAQPLFPELPRRQHIHAVSERSVLVSAGEIHRRREDSTPDILGRV
jgi:hypothetical protein